MFPSLEGMEPVDYARYIAIVLGFLVTSLSREKTFLRADVVCCVGMGIGWLVFPNVFLDFQVAGPQNKAHILYARALGVGFIFSAIPILLNKHTRDNKVFTSLYLSRFLGFALMLLSLFYSHWKFSKSDVQLTARQFWFTGLAIAGWMFGNLRHLLVSGGATNSSERSEGTRLQYHLFADLAFCLPATLYLLAYGPMTFVDLTIKVSDDDAFLRFATYSISSFGIADCLFVLSAHSFDDKEAVKNVFKFRLLATIVYGLMQLTHGLMQTQLLVTMFISYGGLALNALLALHYLDTSSAKTE